MKIKIKTAAVLFLAAAAVYLSIAAIRTVGAPADETPDYYIQNTPSPEKAEFVIKDCDGYIGVYSPQNVRKPENVTSIETGSLRDTDRKLLEKGIPVADKDELLTLLEDFGS